jgi:prepilin-type processing-associated H-X9-DG protein
MMIRANHEGMRVRPPKKSRTGMSTVEVIISVMVVSILFVLLVPLLMQSKEASRRSTCQANLKNVGLGLRLYAREHDGWFPSVGFAHGDLCDDYHLEFMWQGDQMVPDFLTDVSQNICPSDPDGPTKFAEGTWNAGGNPASGIAPCRIGSRSYNYYGYTFSQETYTLPGTDPNDPSISDLGTLARVVNIKAVETAQKFAEAIDQAKTREEAQALADRDIGIPGAIAYRLRLGVEHKVFPGVSGEEEVMEAQAKIVVQHDTISSREGDFNHKPGGVNAVYMDGHVEFIKFPGKFPAQRAWYMLMGSI